MRRLLLLLLALALLATSTACAAAPSFEPHLAIDQQIFDQAGNPWLVANFAPDGALATPTWARCAPGGGPCEPAGLTDQSFPAGPTAAGTTFEASATYRGTTYTARSAPWLGTVAATAPPTLTGTPRVGAHVTPHGGSWTGGWGGEFDILHVEACRTRDGRDCTTIVHPWAFRRSPPIDPRWSGRYLFAFDQRYGRGTAFALVGYSVPFGIAPTPVGATVARSAPLGPVTGPGLALRDHPLLLDGRLLLGRVTCARGCRVSVRVDEGRTDLRSQAFVHGSRRLALPTHGVRVGGELTIRVRVGNAPLVTAFVPPHGVVDARAR